MNMPALLLRPAVAAAVCATLALPVAAQQAPITGRMMDGRQAQAAPVRVAAPAAAAETSAPAMPAPPPPPAYTTDTAPATMPAPPPAGDTYAYTADDDDTVGSTTRQLLRMQASGSQAGRRLPMLGDEASASYKRYIDSFNHPIPEFYQTTIGKDTDSGR